MSIKSLDQLLASHCVEVKGSAMNDADVAAQLKVLDGWTVTAGALAKTYGFNNYYETISFVNALAYVVHREDHHPDLRVAYSSCEVRYSTHSVHGISQNDFILAARSDAIYSNAPLPRTGSA
ncbi:MAG: 4a-hydroxytetrahydrobiopterin dehydratase [Burkholderiaceae bacterium]